MQMPLIHRLTYTWDGWPSQNTSPLPLQPNLKESDSLWERDGLRRLGTRWTGTLAQMTFEVGPGISPLFFASRVKGRLDHALRKAGTPTAWSRKIGFRVLGENTESVVEGYLRQQQIRAELADPAYRRTLAEFSAEFPSVRLEDPAETNSGRYWYNLHLVAVTNDRWRMGREDYLPILSKAIPGWAVEEGAALRSMALMPDHLHLALRGDPARTPGEIAASLYRALNHSARCRLFSDRVYVGTFSSYTRRHIGL